MICQNAERTVKSRTLKLNAPPKQVFPLLCPVREYEWIEHWKCEMVYSESGVAEPNCIFKTRFPGERAEEVWVVSRYEPDRIIEFVRTMPDVKVTKLDIRLTPMGADGASVQWTETVTGLSDLGNADIHAAGDDPFRQKTTTIERMLNHYFETGEMLRLGDR